MIETKAIQFTMHIHYITVQYKNVNIDWTVEIKRNVWRTDREDLIACNRHTAHCKINNTGSVPS